MPSVQDKAEELLHLLYGVGQANVEAVNSGTAVTISNPDPDVGFSTTVLTLNGATPVITMPTPNAIGQRKRLYLVQDGSAPRVASWAGATIHWLAGVAPTLQTGAGDVDFVDFESTDGTTWRGDAWQVPSGGSFTTLHVTGAAVLDSTLTVGSTLAVTGGLGINGKTPAAEATTYTQTYNTAARTIPAATAAGVATTGSTVTTPYGYTSSAQADAIPVAINALEADVLALKKLIVALVQDITAVGIAT